MKSFSVKLAALSLTALAFISCQKEDVSEQDNPLAEVSSSSELQVSESFNFETDRNVQFNVQLSNSKYIGKHKVVIYDGVPNAGGGIVKSVLLNGNTSVQGNITVPTVSEKLYLKLNYPDGSSEWVEKSINGGSLSHHFGVSQGGKKGKGIVSPTCASGCDVDLNQLGKRININGNDAGTVFCLSDKDVDQINVNKSNVTIRVCGSVKIKRINLNNGSKLQITDGSDVEIDNVSLNSASGSITLYDADLKLKRNFSPNGDVIIHGDLEVDEAFNLNGNASLENNGSIVVNKQFTHNGKMFKNNGPFEAKDRFTLNGNSVTQNHCSITANKDIALNAKLENHGLIEGNKKITFNGGGQTTLHNGAMISAEEMTINTTITGKGTTSLLLLEGKRETRINGGGKLAGTLEICDSDGIENNFGSIEAPAREACAVYIPTSNCNSQGHGTPQVADADSDGVSDENDEYPNDARRASSSYYPSSSTFGTLAYEDLWPSQGDYDFNDLVLDYQYKLILNANNQVVDVEARIKPRAIGGSFSNGFAFVLNLSPSAIASVSGQKLNNGLFSVSGNGTENGQTKAVIPVFDNAKDILVNQGGSFVNTIEGNPFVQGDTMLISVAFQNAQSESALGKAPYNPFIVIDQQRGKEVHLSDQAPTDKADSNLLGSNEDDSDPANNRYYKNERNLPWALNITNGFAYPEEKEDIVTVYPFYSTWAQSAGQRATDWNQDISGYINSNVYSSGK